MTLKGVGRKISGGATKNDQKITLLASSKGGRAMEKRPKNSAIKPLSTIFVPCINI